MNVQLISVSLKIKSLFFVVIFCDHLQLEVLLLMFAVFQSILSLTNVYLQRRCSNPDEQLESHQILIRSDRTRAQR